MDRRLAFLITAIAALGACKDGVIPTEGPSSDETATFAKRGGMVELDQSPVSRDLSELNARLAAEGLGVALIEYEYVTAASSDKAGRTVFASDRGNKRLPHDWVPGDPRRGGFTDITWLIDGVDAGTSSGPTAAETSGAVTSAMQTWQDVRCSDIPLTGFGVVPLDLGVVQFFEGFGGFPGWLVDYTHAGWLPAAFFDAIEPGGGAFILGVTFTFMWIDGNGDLTDIDGNGRADTAFRETYYNDAFAWAIDADQGPFGPVDVETVVLHEAGHGLSQDHFGAVFFDASGKGLDQEGGKFLFRHLHFSPYAVMNAVIWDTQQELTGSDIAGHCSDWAQWPKR